MKRRKSLIQKELVSAIERGSVEKAKKSAQSLLNAGISPKEIISNSLSSGMHAVGLKFERGEAFLSDMLTSAMVFEEVMELIKPHLSSVEEEGVGKVVIGTVEGDVHSIGKNLVALMLQIEGFDVVNIGEDVPVKEFINMVKKEAPDILAMSALLSTTAENMKKVVLELQDQNIRGKVAVIIGGPPLDEEFAERIGADAYGKTAFDAPCIARRLISSVR